MLCYLSMIDVIKHLYCVGADVKPCSINQSHLTCLLIYLSSVMKSGSGWRENFDVVGVLLLSAFANHRHVARLDYADQFIIACGGFRGAMTVALVVLLDENVYSSRRLLMTTAVVVIFATNFILVVIAVTSGTCC